MDTLKTRRGQGLRILTRTLSSPTLRSQLEELLRLFPEARWVEYEPVNPDNKREGARLAFGQPLDFHYQFDRAKVIVSLGLDFMCAEPHGVRYAHDFANRRRAQEGGAEMNRLYVVESVPSPTGSVAAHRLPLKPSEMETFARELAARVTGGPSAATAGRQPAEGVRGKWLDAVARDLLANRGQSLVVPGEYEAPETQRQAHLINSALGNVGQTILYVQPQANTTQTDSLRGLARDMAAGQVDVDDSGRQSDLRSPGRFEVHRGVHEDQVAGAVSPYYMTRRPAFAIGTFRRPITWNSGATPSPSTERPLSFSL